MSVMELIKGFCLDFSLMGFLGERKKPKPHTQMVWVYLLNSLA